MTAHSIQLALVAVLFLAMARAGAADAGDSESFKRLPIPERENGYSGLHTEVISSKSELDARLQKVAADRNWNRAQEFTRALNDAHIDFEKQSLVLLCHTEGSGSVQVTFQKPLLAARRLVCKIERKVPEIGTDDMAYYCYALLVKIADVQKVEFQDRGHSTVLILERGDGKAKDGTDGK